MPNVGVPEILTIIMIFAVMILIVAAAYALIVMLARALHGTSAAGSRTRWMPSGPGSPTARSTTRNTSASDPSCKAVERSARA